MTEAKEKRPCEMCGEQVNTETTVFLGSYCIDCHKANIEASREAIALIRKMPK